MNESRGLGTDWIILADHAEVLNGKLYVMGGGWETLTANRPLPFEQPCAIAMAISVPWNETNQQHQIEVEIVDQETGNNLFRYEAEVEVGKPPGMPLGQAQRVQVAANLGLRFEKFGPHVVIVKIGGQEDCRTTFNVVRGPGLA